MHGGTHIARPDRTVDSQGTGAKWRHATWLAFLVKLAIDHGRVLGLQALQRADVRPEKVQIMIPKPRAVHFTAEEIKSEARRAPIFSLQDVGKLFRQLCVSEWQRLESVSHDEDGSLSAVVQFETQKEADLFTARHRAFLLRKNMDATVQRGMYAEHVMAPLAARDAAAANAADAVDAASASGAAGADAASAAPAGASCQQDPGAPVWPPVVGSVLTARYNQKAKWKAATVTAVKGARVFVIFAGYSDVSEILSENVSNSAAHNIQVANTNPAAHTCADLGSEALILTSR